MYQNYFSNIMKDLINSYLNSQISKTDMINQLCTRITISEAMECEDEVLRECYSAIFHMNEKYCDVTDHELVYYKDCLEGKQIFSRIERDKIIKGKIGRL
jgi:hypothetical protein